MCVYVYIKILFHALSFANIADFRYLFEGIDKFFAINKEFRGLVHISSYF